MADHTPIKYLRERSGRAAPTLEAFHVKPFFDLASAMFHVEPDARPD
jgi:hypothetical protein